MKNPTRGVQSIRPEIDSLASEYSRQPAAVLEVFQALQKRNGGLRTEDIQEVAAALRIPEERAFGVASFYSMLALQPEPKEVLRICDGPPCWLRGSQAIHTAAEENLAEAFRIERTSCLGLCDRAPAGLVGLDPCGPLTQGKLDEIREGWRGKTMDYSVPRAGEVRVLLANIDSLDPRSLESAREQGAYDGLRMALNLAPNEVIDEVEHSKVRGRGGAGFPAGRKWRIVAQSPETDRYIVCNADESEPLVFKDRVLLETNPHQVLEGMAIAGYAVGAQEAFIYIRGEYNNQAELLARAIQDAEGAGLLGDKIFGTDFSFRIHLHRGAGAYICGEETALLESLEGRRGEPRVRPPYPATYGYHGCPTVLNNVETFATIPYVLRNSADAYLKVGNPASPGTKLYTLLGHIRRPGLFEAPYRLTLREIIETFGEGMLDGSDFFMALTGGAAGTIVSPAALDIPLDYDSGAKGISLGAGAILVCDSSVSPIALVRELMHFFEVESCGKCTPCRIGTRLVREILDRMSAGQARPTDFEELTRLARLLEVDSFCGLGQFAALPLKTALSQFEAVFTSHVE